MRVYELLVTCAVILVLSPRLSVAKPMVHDDDGVVNMEVQPPDAADDREWNLEQPDNVDNNPNTFADSQNEQQEFARQQEESNDNVEMESWQSNRISPSLDEGLEEGGEEESQQTWDENENASEDDEEENEEDESEENQGGADTEQDDLLVLAQEEQAQDEVIEEAQEDEQQEQQNEQQAESDGEAEAVAEAEPADPEVPVVQEDPSTTEADAGGEQHGTDGIGVLNPEELLHDGDGHAHEHAQKQDSEHEHEYAAGCKDCEEAAAAAVAAKEQQARDKEAFENEEMRNLEPRVLTNVHDTTARTAAEFMKGMQFGAGDLESVVHGGHHVHGEDSHLNKKAGAGDLDRAIYGEDGLPSEKEEEKGIPTVVDPEQLMHAADGGHDHNPHSEDAGRTEGSNQNPGMESPEEILHRGQEGDWAHDHAGDKTRPKATGEGVGVNVEQAVYGQDHVPDHDDSKPRGKKIMYQDIVDLGLSEELLQGIDLTKLMEEDEKEFEDYKKEIEDANTDPSFWDRVSKWVNQFRKNYFSGLASQVREITPPDLENAEWDEGFDDREVRRADDDVHEGETRLEHEMEMWGNTASKGNRKPLKNKLAPRSEDVEEQQDL